MHSVQSVHVDVHLDPAWRERTLRADVVAGLTASPKSLPPKWFYDDIGSELFDAITRLPEYYPTECEREILRREAGTIAEVSGADAIVELGSGTSDKTRTLLDAFTARGGFGLFVPFDVSEATLRAAAEAINAEHPDVEVHAVVGDFEHHLADIPVRGRRMFVFLGGTIGNFEPAARKVFVESLAAAMRPGDSLLLGTDLVKDVARLELAYDDPAGVTAAFNKNVLAVLNRELGADFDLGAFDHVAFFDHDAECIDIRLRSKRDQTVHVADLDLVVHFEEGEDLHTEISAKFRLEGVVAELASAGLVVAEQWTDAAGDFLVTLAFRDELAVA